MPDASFIQTNFAGGQWSGWHSGRADHAKYKTALAVCYNALPTEEGAWTRRSGTRYLADTSFGQSAKIMPFVLAENTPFMLEFTSTTLRLFSPALISPQRSGLVWDESRRVIDISTANPAVVTVHKPVTWASGTQVEFYVNTPNVAWGLATLRRRVFKITPVGSAGTQFSLAGVDGSTVGWNPALISGTTVGHVGWFTPPYTASTPHGWEKLRGIQVATLGQDLEVFLHRGYAPQSLTVSGQVPDVPPVWGQFSFGPFAFKDGPYLDPPTDGSYIVPSAKTGSITLTAVGAAPFAATDVGRLVRLFAQPTAWAPGNPYNVGDTVSWPGPGVIGNLSYTCIQANTGFEPDFSPAQWSVDPTAMKWAWVTITAFTSVNVVTAHVSGDDLLYTNHYPVYRLGAYSDTTAWPTCGCFSGGRLWLAGAFPNRFDASTSNDVNSFAPTESDGTVADNDAIDYTLDSSDIETINWMIPAFNGIACGTLSGEWLLQASQLSDPFTPTSIQAQRVTKYGSVANVQPAAPGLALVFAQKFGRQARELLPDVFTGKFQAPNLSLTAKDLTKSGIRELAYQQELVPIIWARMDNGSLAGCSYKRVSAFTTEDPAFAGWHQHALGGGRIVESMAVGPNASGTLDNLWLITYQPDLTQPDSGVRHVEMLMDLFDLDSSLEQAWFLDNAVVPTGAALALGSGVDTLTFYGLWHLNGQTVDVWFGGLDLGQWSPVVNGSLAVAVLPATNPLFSLAYIQSFTAGVTWTEPDGVTTITTEVDNVIPAVSFSGAQTPYTIQAYFNATGGVISAANSAVDWRNALLYLADGGTLHELPMESQYPIAHLPYSAMLTVGNFAGFGTPFCVGTDGKLYGQSGNSNTNVLVQYSPTTLQPTATYGTQSSTTNGLWNAGDGLTGDVSAIVGVTGGVGNNYVVVSSAIPSAQQVAVYNADQMKFAGFAVNTVGQRVALIAGPFNQDFGLAYAVDNDFNAGPRPAITLYRLSISAGAETYASTTAALGAWAVGTTYTLGALVSYHNWTYKSLVGVNLANNPASTLNTDWALVQNPSITWQTIGSLVPTDIDPTWANTSGMNAGPTILYDGTDGNVIITVAVSNTFAPVVNFTNYIVKVRVADGAVLWAIGSNTVLTLPLDAQITSEILGVMVGASGGSIWAIDTLRGIYTTMSAGNLFNVSASYFDGINNNMLVRCYTNNTLPPTPINGTPGTLPDSGGDWTILTPGTFLKGGTVQGTSASYSVPVVVGHTYASRGQLLRGLAPQEIGAANGPGLGKTRRAHMFATHMWNTGTGITFGTDFSATLRKADFRSPGGTPVSALQTFTGVYWSPIDDGYSFDSQVAWQVTRPFPATILATGGFVHSQDR